jgi:hypothetical protein
MPGELTNCKTLAPLNTLKGRDDFDACEIVKTIMSVVYNMHMGTTQPYPWEF